MYPESLAMVDRWGYLPLHILLWNKSSSIACILIMIEKYPAALKNGSALLPRVECVYKSKPSMISKCIAILHLYPELLNQRVAFSLFNKINKSKLHACVHGMSILLTIYPMSFYFHHSNDSGVDPHYRRLILKLLPRHVFGDMNQIIEI
jgi:hypothetical protein